MNTLNDLVKTLILSVVLLSILSCNQEPHQTKGIIKKDELPTTAHAFVNRHFPGFGYSRIDKNAIVANDGKMYEVELMNGLEILFNSQGEWIKIKGPNTTKIPLEIVPEKIAGHINKHYPEHFIQAIDTDASNYKILLSNKENLVYDDNGQFVRLIN